MSEAILDMRTFLMGGVALPSAPTPGYEALTYPLEEPAAVGIRSIEWAMESVRGISESPFTLHRQIFRHMGERWSCRVTLPTMPRDKAAEWQAFLLLLDGGYGTVLFGDVFRPTPLGQALGAPVVNGSGQTGKTLQVRGFQPNKTNQLLPGDWLQLGYRLYRNLRAAHSDENGEAILDIWPRLRTSPFDGDQVILANTAGTFRIAQSSIQLYSEDITGASSIAAFSLIEAV